MTGPAGIYPPAVEPVRMITPDSNLGEVEDFTAAMRAAGAERGSVVLIDGRFITRLGGYPRGTRGGTIPADDPGAAGTAPGVESVERPVTEDHREPRRHNNPT